MYIYVAQTKVFMYTQIYFMNLTYVKIFYENAQ